MEPTQDKQIQLVNTVLIGVIGIIIIILSVTLVRVVLRKSKQKQATKPAVPVQPHTFVKPNEPPPEAQIAQAKRTITLIPQPVIFPSDKEFLIPRRFFLKEEPIQKPGARLAKNITSIDDKFTITLLEIDNLNPETNAPFASLDEYAKSSFSVHKPSEAASPTTLGGQEGLKTSTEAYIFSKDKKKIYVLTMTTKSSFDKQEAQTLFTTMLSTIQFRNS